MTSSLKSTQPVSSFASTGFGDDTVPPDVCAKFVTTSDDGRVEVLLLGVGKPLIIGRNPSLCTYVVPDIVASNVHFKLYAVRTSVGSIMISCQDLSTNGLLLNGRKFRKTSVLVMNGDTIKIPSSQSFQCLLKWKEIQERKTPHPTLTPSSDRLDKNVGGYLITSHCLGSGSYASVYLALNTSAQRQAACKVIKRKEGSDLKKEMKEATLLMKFRHPNINKVYAVDSDPEFLYIMLQLSTGGDLFTYITSNPRKRLGEGETKWIMYQMLNAIKYLHDRQISHRDLKPENILLLAPGPYPQIQLADFGLARPKAYQETLHVCGTISYLPPEGILALQHKHLGYVGMPADCWSAGVTLYAMLSGSHPFEAAGSTSAIYAADDYESAESQNPDQQTKQRILDGRLYFDSVVWYGLTDAKELVRDLLVTDHQQRATVYQGLRSRWISQDSDELEDAYQERIQLAP